MMGKYVTNQPVRSFSFQSACHYTKHWMDVLCKHHDCNCYCEDVDEFDEHQENEEEKCKSLAPLN